MPEFIRSFQAGKMNKDLDERLVPQGQYRDALNLDLANSEGSNVGTLQNVKGNVELRGKISDIENGWQANYIEDLDNPVCIASIKNDIDEKIYWFIASDSVSAIAELDTTTGYIHPILVDTNNILNFSADYLITGVNIIDKFLFWTDDQTEPKRINIEKFKAGSCNFAAHTKIPEWNPDQDTYTAIDCGFVGAGQVNFTEEDIAVIKKSPLKAPALNIAASPFGNNVNGTGILPISFEAGTPAGTGTENFTFIPDEANFPSAYESLPTFGQFLENTTGPNGNPDYYENSNLPSNWDGRVTFTLYDIYGNDPDTGSPAWNIDDVILISGSFVDDFNETFEYQIRIKIKQLNNTVITGEIQAISSDIQKFGNTLIQWEAILEEKTPMFEYLFPRFAYRWKYIDNEYSTFSPFSEVAFVGNEFKYVSSDGYNIGMKNNIRKLIIQDLEAGSEEVSEIEILYKESHNTAVYSVDTIKKKDFIPYTTAGAFPTVFEIKSEIIGALIQSNQLLRPWDNVPRKAKAQEVVGNRIVYANYLQNYSVNNLIDLSVSVTSKNHQSLNPELTDEERAANLRMPEASLKSIRTYQAGVVFKDEFGRETPVFTNKKSSINLEVVNAHRVNNLQIEPLTSPPDWATHYKFFIKETSNQYYNLALDRFYLAEDGNVWLSFPSSERNKVDEETYLILKKQHDNDVFVENLVRYKILSIKNEAPTFVKTFDTVQLNTNVTIIDGFFQDSIFLQFSSGNPTMPTSLTSDNYIRIISGGFRTDLYKIAGGGETSSGSGNFDIQLDEPIGADGAFLQGLTGAVVEIIAKKEENKPEFEGRFFAKINRDFAFDTNIISTFGAIEPRYGIRERVEPKGRLASSNTVNNGSRFGLYYQDPGEDSNSTCLGGSNPGSWYLRGTGSWGGGAFGGVWLNYQPPTQQSSWFGISRVGCNYGDFINEGFGRANDSVDGLLTAGAYIRFENKSTGEYGDVYRVVEIYKRFFHGRGKRNLTCDQTGDAGNRRTSIVMRVDRTITDPWLPTQGQTSVLDSVLPTIQILVEAISDNNKLLTSSNPAIFETEPKEAIDLDLYYEASNALPIADYNNPYELTDYYNCYSYGNGVESNRIRDDFNAHTIDKGPKVSAPLDEPYAQERRGNGLIFSQIFNSTSGINRLNQFIQAEPITKDLNPTYGTIQKLHTRQTDLLSLCEDKIVKILANKDALFNADGNVNLTGNNAVLGQAMVPATFGEFGISKNPESFAADNYRIYFTDKNRGAVLRLSMNGVTDIAGKGMSDFFADNLKASNKLIGSFDKEKDLYNITFDRLSQDWNNILSPSQEYQLTPECDINFFTKCNNTTVSFKEMVDGWTSRKSFIPESGISLNNIYYTFKDGRIYEHGLNILYNNFYRQQYDSSFNVVMNDGPQSVKGFSTINYTGTRSRRFEYLHDSEWYSIAEINAIPAIPTSIQQKQPGWYVNYVKTDLEGGEVKEFEKKEGKHFNYIKGLEIFNDCDDTPDGIGNPDVIDSDPQDYILTVTIDEGCSGSGGVTPDTVQFFVNIWDNIKTDPALDLDIVNETTAQDVKCAIEAHYDLLYQSYGATINNGTAFSYLSSDGLQVGTQMYNSLTNEPIATAGAYLFVGVGEQMSDLTVSHAGLDANNATIVPSTYYVMILNGSGQIVSWTQYNTLAACEQDCLPDTPIYFYWFRNWDDSLELGGLNWSGFTDLGQARYFIEQNFTNYPNAGPLGNINAENRYNIADGINVGTKIWNLNASVLNPCVLIESDALYLWVGSSTVDPNLALDPNDPTPIPNEYKFIKLVDGRISEIVQYNSVTPTP